MSVDLIGVWPQGRLAYCILFNRACSSPNPNDETLMANQCRNQNDELPARQASAAIGAGSLGISSFGFVSPFELRHSGFTKAAGLYLLEAFHWMSPPQMGLKSQPAKI